MMHTGRCGEFSMLYIVQIVCRILAPHMHTAWTQNHKEQALWPNIKGSLT